MKETFIPQLNLLIIQRDVPKDTTDGGIVIPDKARPPLPKGTVLRVGPGAIRADGERVPVSADLAPGARVLFVPSQAVALPDREHEFLVPETAILCRIETEREPTDEDYAKRPVGAVMDGGVAS